MLNYVNLDILYMILVLKRITKKVTPAQTAKMKNNNNALQNADLCSKIRELEAISEAAERNVDENYFHFISTLPYFGRNQFQTKIENEILESNKTPQESISNCSLVNNYVYQKNEISKLQKQAKELEQTNRLLESKLSRK